jgi:hypothetical protein
MAPHGFESRVEDEAERKTEADQTRDANELRDELPGVAVKKASDRTGYAVPGAGVVALPIGKWADGDDAPDAVGSMHGDRVHDVVQLRDALNFCKPKAKA